MYEEMANNNPITYNDLGYAERSSHGANMAGKGRMGGLLVRDIHGIEFGIGTGFDEFTRIDYWNRKNDILGRIACYRHQPHGAKDKPRIPVFVGLRAKRNTRETIPFTCDSIRFIMTLI